MEINQKSGRGPVGGPEGGDAAGAGGKVGGARGPVSGGVGADQRADGSLPPPRDGRLPNVAFPGADLSPARLKEAEAALQRALEGFAAAGSPAASFTGDIAKLLSRIMIEQAGEAKQNALRDRLNAREAARGDLLSQAHNMHEAASKMMAGAVASLVTGTISGALSIGAAGVSLGTSVGQIRNMTSQIDATRTATEAASAATDEVGNASKILKNAGLGKTDKAQLASVIDTAGRAKTAAEQAASQAADAFRLASAKADAAVNLGRLGEAIGGLGRSIGSGSEAHYQAGAKADDARAAEEAAQAQYTQQTADMKKDVQDAAADMIRQIIAFIKELRDAEVEAMRAITRA